MSKDEGTLRVYKYALIPNDLVTLEMEEGAQILAVQEQRGEPFIWALVNPRAPMRTRKFRLAGTGHDIVWREGMVHRGTFQLNGGSLVFHLFEYASRP